MIYSLLQKGTPSSGPVDPTSGSNLDISTLDSLFIIGVGLLLLALAIRTIFKKYK